MTSEPLSCPFCNAQVSLSGSVPAGQRISCPRCGETFAPRITGTNTAAQQLPPAAAHPPVNANGVGGPVPVRSGNPFSAGSLFLLSGVLLIAGLFLYLFLGNSGQMKNALPMIFGLGFLSLVAAVWLWYFRLPRSNRSTAGFLLANMGVMVGIALTFALLTTHFRRSHDPRLGPVAAVHPADLGGLSYLPPTTELIAAVHYGEIVEEQDLLKKLSSGPLDVGLAQVETWIGMPRELLDHVVFGVTVLDPAFRLTVVIQTRQPYKRETLVATWGPSEEQHHGQPLFHLKVAKGTEGLLWCAEERTLVVVIGPKLKLKDLEAISDRPRSGVAGLSPPLRQVITERLRQGTPLWIAGHLEQPWLLALLLGQAGPLGQDLQSFAKVQTFDVGLRLGHEVITVAGDFSCVDPQAARNLEKYFRKKGESLKDLKVSGPLPFRPDYLAVLAAPTGSMVWTSLYLTESKVQDSWVSLQIRVPPERIHDWLAQLGTALPGKSKRK
jgi:hypothetical protein